MAPDTHLTSPLSGRHTTPPGRMAETPARIKPLVMDDTEHEVGTECFCSPLACRVCGGAKHYQAVYGGFYQQCEACGDTSTQIFDGPDPAPRPPAPPESEQEKADRLAVEAIRDGLRALDTAFAYTARLVKEAKASGLSVPAIRILLPEGVEFEIVQPNE